MNVEALTLSAAKKAAQVALFEDGALTRNTALFFTGVPQTNLHPVAAAHNTMTPTGFNVSIFLHSFEGLGFCVFNSLTLVILDIPATDFLQGFKTSKFRR